MQTLLSVARSLSDLVAPVDCAGCSAPGRHVCTECGLLLAVPVRSVSPDPPPPGMPPTWAGPGYDGAVRGLIIAWKEEGRHALTAPLSAMLARVVPSATRETSGPVVLVPVPSRRDARRLRGGDLVQRLAATTARRLARSGMTVDVVPALGHVRAVQDQAGLHAEERAANLRRALGVHVATRSRLLASSVVVVDDILTTGATLAEAARALRTVGVRPVGACLAATARTRAGTDRLLSVDRCERED